jgi:hypothetical protein
MYSEFGRTTFERNACIINESNQYCTTKKILVKHFPIEQTWYISQNGNILVKCGGVVALTNAFYNHSFGKLGKIHGEVITKRYSLNTFLQTVLLLIHQHSVPKISHHRMAYKTQQKSGKTNILWSMFALMQ